MAPDELWLPCETDDGACKRQLNVHMYAHHNQNAKPHWGIAIYNIDEPANPDNTNWNIYYRVSQGLELRRWHVTRREWQHLLAGLVNIDRFIIGNLDLVARRKESVESNNQIRVSTEQIRHSINNSRRVNSAKKKTRQEQLIIQLGKIG